MKSVRYAIALLLGACVMSVVVIVVLQRLDALMPSIDGAAAATARATTTAPRAVTVPGASVDSAALPSTAALPATPQPAPRPAMPAPRTVERPRAAGAGTPAAPWAPTPEAAFADALYLALQRADTARAVQLLATRPSQLSETAELGALRLDARLARAQRDTSRLRTAYAALLLRDHADATRREAAEAARDAGDFRTAATLMAALLTASPSDTSLRAAYLETLLSAGDSSGFLAHLDTLARATGSAARYDRLAVSLEAANQADAARAAFRAAIQLAPTAERWTRLGDRLRWADSLDASLLAYARALALQPNAGRALEGTSIATRLRRDAQPSPVFIAPRPADPEAGVGALARAGDDNTGWSFRAIGVQAGLPLTRQGLTLLVAADVRETGRPLRSALEGTNWSAGLAQTFGRARVAARAGQLSHAGVQRVTTWAADARAPIGRFELRAAAAREAAYEVLRAGATLAPVGSDTALTARTLRGTVLGTLQPGLELWSQVEQIRFGDANRRSSLQLAVQQAVRPGIGIVIAGGVTGFRNALPTYWTPSRYSLGSVGLDLRAGAPSRVAVYARLLPGIGDVRGLPGGNGTAVQFSAGAGAAIERGRWRAAFDAAAGRDREGGYQIWSGELRVTRTLP